MPQYTVEFMTTTTITVGVEADDPESALDLAGEEGQPAICAQCSGWRQTWTKDEGEYEPVAVYDANDKQVWGEGAAVDGETEGTA